METVLVILASPAFLQVAGVLFTALLGKIVKDHVRKAFVEKVIAEALPIAYFGVNEIARRTPNKIDDKVAAGLKILKDYVEASGVKEQEIKPQHLAKAKLVFDAMHAQEKANVIQVVEEVQEAPTGVKPGVVN